MSEDSSEAVARLLRAWHDGDEAAFEQLVTRFHEELRSLAARHLAREFRRNSLPSAALVNEAYLRLIGHREAGWKTRAHFLAVASRVMRNVLVDHCRHRQAARRGGAALQLTFDEQLDRPQEPDVDLLDLDRALDRLESLNPRQAKIVELRYFVGCGVRETAEILDLSPATVKREWSVARAWLYRALSGGPLEG